MTFTLKKSSTCDVRVEGVDGFDSADLADLKALDNPEAIILIKLMTSTLIISKVHQQVFIRIDILASAHQSFAGVV